MSYLLFNTPNLLPLFLEATGGKQQMGLQLAADSNKTFPSPLLVMSFRSLVIVDESLGRSDESLVIVDESLGRSDEPLVIVDESLVRANEPLVIVDESLGRSDVPLVIVDESLVRSDGSLVIANISSQTTEKQCGATALTPSVGHRLKRVF